MTIKEQAVVDLITSECHHRDRFVINNHGTLMAQGGVPDIVTIDHTGRFLAIEAKTIRQRPTVNQLRRAFEILRSGGRYVVAYPDFEFHLVDHGEVPTITVDDVSEFGCEFELAYDFPMDNRTVELIASNEGS